MASVISAVPMRRLGRTDENVSMVALGGGHLGTSVLSDIEAVHLIHRGIDQGVTFLDNSWDYDGGRSEERMGAAIGRGGYRRRVFLATKFDGRDRQTARQTARRIVTAFADRSRRFVADSTKTSAPMTPSASSRPAVPSKR